MKEAFMMAEQCGLSFSCGEEVVLVGWLMGVKSEGKTETSRA